MGTAIQTGVLAALSIKANVLGYRATNVYSLLPAGRPTFGTATDGSSGDFGTKLLPTQTSGLISLRTARIGQKYRGRIYIPFPDTFYSSTNSGQPAGAYLAVLSGLGGQLLGFTGFTAGSGTVVACDAVLWHSAAQTRTSIVEANASVKWATQKRRGMYGVPNNTFNP